MWPLAILKTKKNPNFKPQTQPTADVILEQRRVPQNYILYILVKPAFMPIDFPVKEF